MLTAEQIRELIMSGVCKPGTRLKVQMLADRLQVSRTPVSDALGRLHKKGLIDYAPHRGYGARQFDLGLLLASFDVRLTLEGLACRIVATK